MFAAAHPSTHDVLLACGRTTGFRATPQAHINSLLGHDIYRIPWAKASNIYSLLTILIPQSKTITVQIFAEMSRMYHTDF